MLKEQKGITLIALVITIIVLLILNIVKYTRGIRTYESDCRKME